LATSCTANLDVESVSLIGLPLPDTQQEFEVIVLNKVESNFISVWFNTHKTPWADGKACALDAFTHFQSNVCCVASSWQEGDAPDQLLNIGVQGENTIDWL
jgi:hypothetical protein